MEREIQTQPLAAPGRHREGRNPRQAIMAVPTVLNGHMPLGSPGAADHRLEQKAAFVHQDDTVALLVGFLTPLLFPPPPDGFLIPLPVPARWLPEAPAYAP